MPMIYDSSTIDLILVRQKQSKHHVLVLFGLMCWVVFFSKKCTFNVSTIIISILITVNWNKMFWWSNVFYLKVTDEKKWFPMSKKGNYRLQGKWENKTRQKERHCTPFLLAKSSRFGKLFKSKGYPIKFHYSGLKHRGSVCLHESVLPLAFPCFNTAIIHVVLLPSVVDKFPIVTSIFLNRSKDLSH